MREAIGSSLLLNIVIVFIGVISMFLVSSIAYSKAFKAKGRIISIIEKYDGECFDSNANDDSCYKEIEAELTNMGYSSNISNKECSRTDYNDMSRGLNLGKSYPTNNYDSGHAFCVYKYKLCDDITAYGLDYKCSDDANIIYYYKVTTFMHFDIPLIGQFLEFPVSGETKSFYDTFVNIKSE